MITLSREQIKTELQRAVDNHGLIQPVMVVDQARPEDAPLHGGFEWDNAIAGELHRIEQARGLIQTYIVTVEGRRETISLPRDRRDGGGYRTAAEVMNRPDLRREAVRQAWSELLQWRKRNELFEEFTLIFKTIDKLDFSQ